MRQKRQQPEFYASEPEFLIGVMNRHQGWAAIVCLIGGGQEINTGEAGIEEWLCAARDHYPDWHIYISHQLESIGYLHGFDLAPLESRLTRAEALHLSVSLRSFRSERLSGAVGALVSGDAVEARMAMQDVLKTFPIFITRSLQCAKHYLRQRARGSERYGLLASSGAKRIKALGIHVDVPLDPANWFLNGQDDVRSSYYLEDAATEFEVQGLELDWTAVLWDGDLVYQDGGWSCRRFRGTAWQAVRDEQAQRYRQNAYRVLLTRARQGMVIVVPEGDVVDPTRLPAQYDPTWHYLQSIGLPQLD